MKIIKRSGQEMTFDSRKIANAVAKANAVVEEKDQLTKEQIQEIASNVQETCSHVSRALGVEEIQELVEDQIMHHGAYEVAKKYVTYR